MNALQRCGAVLLADPLLSYTLWEYDPSTIRRGTCHAGMAKALWTSNHTEPSCTTPHIAHSMNHPASIRWAIYPTHVSGALRRCQGNVAKTSRFNVLSGRLGHDSSLLDLAGKVRSMTAVNCTRCSWAVIWGGVLMTITGLMLRAHNLVLAWLPMVFLQLASTIHFYEAVLAALAILVWHFYSVIFDPEVYLMDPAWVIRRSVRQCRETGSGPKEEEKAEAED